MIDPPRWLEEGSDAPDEVRELLRHAPRSRALDRATLIATAVAVTGLGARPAIAVALAKLVALPQAVAALPIAAKVVTSIAVMSAVAIVTVPQASPPRARPSAAATSAAATSASMPQAKAAAVPAVPPAPQPLVDAAPTPVPDESADGTTPSTTTPRAMRRLRAPALDRGANMSASANLAPATEPAAPVDTLAAEVASLDAARAVLGSAPARALHLADAHAAAVPDATLSAERELIAIDALLRLGRRAEARARADRLRTRYPGGLYESRLSALLE